MSEDIDVAQEMGWDPEGDQVVCWTPVQGLCADCDLSEMHCELVVLKSHHHMFC